MSIRIGTKKLILVFRQLAYSWRKSYNPVVIINNNDNKVILYTAPKSKKSLDAAASIEQMRFSSA